MRGGTSISVTTKAGEGTELLRALKDVLDAHPLEPGGSIEITVTGASAQEILDRAKALLAS